MTILIKNGKLITAAEIFEADILVEGEQIAQIGVNLPAPEGAQVVDASGKLVLPGGVDAHVHLALPMARHHLFRRPLHRHEGRRVWRHHHGDRFCFPG